MRSALVRALLPASLVLTVGGCERPPREVIPSSSRPETPDALADSDQADQSEASDPLVQDATVINGPEGARAASEAALEAPRFRDEPSRAIERDFEPLSSWVRKNGGRIHAALIDLESDQWLLKENAEQAVNVASNAKIPTAAAALTLLGPAYRFKTELFGHIDAQGNCKRLVLRGGGDPGFDVADLFRFVAVLKGRGLGHVDEIVVDQSLFEGPFVPPAFEQQPNEWAPFRANISALSINQNAVTLNVATTEEGEKARHWYDPPGVVVDQGTVSTATRGSGDRVQWSLSEKDDPQRLISRVGGSLGVDSDRRRYARRLDDPRLAAGFALSTLLQEANVPVSNVSLGVVGDEARLALWYSEPLAELVRALGKDSDNFYAEMVLVALSQAPLGEPTEGKKKAGAFPSDSWSSERGARVLSEWLKELGVWGDGTVVRNGSGLFDANRYSPALLSSLLARIEDNPRIYHDFVSHLAMGQTDGTMEKRMGGDDVGQRIRAKTGTLRNVDALSGYIGRTGGRSPLSFSIIVEDARASHSEVRRRVDQVVLSWAKTAN